MLTCPMGEVGDGGEPGKEVQRRWPPSKDPTGSGISVTLIEVIEDPEGDV